jgi:Protein of unknown function (DUF1064)
MNKYHAKPTIVDNVRFASAREASRYKELCLLRASGAISHLELQPRYDLIVNGRKIGFYKADFRYISSDGQSHIEDAKGVRTAVYALKKRIVEALYGITIEEV